MAGKKKHGSGLGWEVGGLTTSSALSYCMPRMEMIVTESFLWGSASVASQFPCGLFVVFKTYTSGFTSPSLST